MGRHVQVDLRMLDRLPQRFHSTVKIFKVSTPFQVMSAKRVGSYFVLMRQWGMVKLSRPKEIHHAPF
jgi:hypothetical protein